MKYSTAKELCKIVKELPAKQKLEENRNILKYILHMLKKSKNGEHILQGKAEYENHYGTITREFPWKGEHTTLPGFEMIDKRVFDKLLKLGYKLEEKDITFSAHVRVVLKTKIDAKKFLWFTLEEACEKSSYEWIWKDIPGKSLVISACCGEEHE